MKMTFKQLKNAKQFFKDNPDGEIIVNIWPKQNFNRQQWNKWFIGCLNDKINRNNMPLWRKLDPDYQWDLKRSQHLLNHPRLIIDWLPSDLKNRFAHRLRCNM